MAGLFIGVNETLTALQKGVQSRHGGRITTKIVEEALGIDCGLFVCPSGTAGDACEDCDSALDVKKAIGVTLYQAMREDFDSTHHYGENDFAAVLTEGYVAVEAEGTVVADEPVFARHTSDGGSNTILGKARANSNGTVVIDTTSTVEGVYRVTLFNGKVNETFSYQTDGSASANEIAAGLVAAIDASANYSAAGTTECTITLVVGNQIKIVQLAGPTAAAEALYTVVDNQLAEQVPGAYFAASRTGAGLVEIQIGATAGKA